MDIMMIQTMLDVYHAQLEHMMTQKTMIHALPAQRVRLHQRQEA